MEWIREGEALPPPSEGDADSARAFRPWIIEENHGRLRMWYSGHDGTTSRILGAAKRTGEPWERLGVIIDAGFSGETDDFGVESPCVVTTPAGYLMAYGGCDGEITRIHIATSADGHRWIPQGTVMQRGIEDAVAATDPCLVVTGSQWWLFYSGYGESAGIRSSSILAAVSSSGASWDRIGPVLLPRPEEWSVSRPCVVDISRGYYMFYEANDTNGSTIAMADSTDGASWQRRGVTLGASSAARLEEASVHDPCVVRLNDGSVHMWYGAPGAGDPILGRRIRSARFPNRWPL